MTEHAAFYKRLRVTIQPQPPAFDLAVMILPMAIATGTQRHFRSSPERLREHA